MADDGRKRAKRTTTWTRSKRACRFCSSRKQRCELPQDTDDFETVFTRCLDQGLSLPDHLRCERCHAGGRECVPAVPGFGRQVAKGSTRNPSITSRPRGASTTTATPSDGHTESQSSPSNAPMSPGMTSSMVNNNLSRLIRDIPSEHASSVLFPHCSGVFPKEMRSSPLSILPYLCRDVGPKQRELKALLDKYDSPSADSNAPLPTLVDADALQLLFDCFPGLDRDFVASQKETLPILHDLIKYTAAFVCTGRHRYLKNFSEGAMFVMLACAASIPASLVLTFVAAYLPIEVAPTMPPAQDMNFPGFAETVNATGLLKIASSCASRAVVKRPSAAYVLMLNVELTRSFLLGESLESCRVKLEEAKFVITSIQTTDEIKIAIAGLRCRLAMIEAAFITQDSIKEIFASQVIPKDLESWDLPCSLPVNFTDSMRAQCRAALGVFCRETDVDYEGNRHPFLSSLNAIAARLEMVLLLKSHYLTMEPLVDKHPDATLRIMSDLLDEQIGFTKFKSIWRFRDRTVEVARRLLLHSNEAFDTRYPTIMATRDMLTSIALASKQLLENHVVKLATRDHNEDEMQSDGMLLRQTAASLARAETILSKALAVSVESMAKALKTWQNKLIKMDVSAQSAPSYGSSSGMEQTIYGQSPSGIYDPVRQVTTPQIQHTVLAMHTPPSDTELSEATMAIMNADWDSVLTDLLGPDMDWDWISF